MKKKKIALMIDWYLPGTKAGGPVRSVYSLIEALKDYYDFYVITTNCDLGSDLPYGEIIADTLFLKERVYYYYFSKKQLRSKNILILTEEIKPDLIYLNSFWSYNFSINIVRLKRKGIFTVPILLAPRGMLGKGALSLKSAKKSLFLSVANIMGWYHGVVFHATQQQELTDIKALFPENVVLIAPNINSGSVKINSSEKNRNAIKLFYLSRIARVKNLNFALSVLKRISKEILVSYDIFGNLEDEEYWNECLTTIKELPKNITVSYKSELEFDEVQSTISGYNALFLPTLNENFGHSIVESLLCGCPVIISDQTPWNDLEDKGAGFAISLKEKEKFVAAITKLAKLDQTEYRAMSVRANKYISEKINIQAITAEYKKLFNDCIKNGPIDL